MKQKIATLSILNSDRKKNASKINTILSKHSLLINVRLGLNVQKTCTKNCQTLISLVLSASKEEIRKLEKDLNSLNDLKVKVSIF